MTRQTSAAELAGQGICIACGIKKPKLNRGLCTQHYQSFVREKRSFSTASAKHLFDLRAVEEGKILPSKKSSDPNLNPTIFKELASKVRREIQALTARDKAIDELRHKLGREPFETEILARVEEIHRSLGLPRPWMPGQLPLPGLESVKAARESAVIDPDPERAIFIPDDDEPEPQHKKSDVTIAKKSAGRKGKRRK